MIYELYGEKRTNIPNYFLADSLKNRILHEEWEERVEGYTGTEKETKYRPLWEIYFYLFYGLYTRAWYQINKLSNEKKWKVPKDVYQFLEELHA